MRTDVENDEGYSKDSDGRDRELRENGAARCAYFLTFPPFLFSLSKEGVACQLVPGVNTWRMGFLFRRDFFTFYIHV